eukprot:gene11683-7830_t
MLENCARDGENRVAIRALGGFDALLKLLLNTNEKIRHTAAVTICGCVNDNIDDIDPLKELGGLQAFVRVCIDSLDKTSNSYRLQNLTITLSILSSHDENKSIIRDCGGFPKLLRLLDHGRDTKGLKSLERESLRIKEKALGSLYS